MRRFALLGAVALLAGCQAEDGAGPATSNAPASPPATVGEAPPSPNLSLPAPQSGGGQAIDPATVPQIHLALEPSSAGPVSVVFAIDRSKDNTPGDDPAIRISPEAGECNPQELRRYSFPPPNSPVFGPQIAQTGVGARDLPAYMALTVSQAMVSNGLATTLEETGPQNICTRKLWEVLTTPGGSEVLAGQ
ncbi:MAG: hypothetical protein AAGI34_14340 [Pseudomonadota bacterium]